MNARPVCLLLAAVTFAGRAFSADEPEPKPPPNAHEVLNALIRAEAAKKQAAAKAANPDSAATADSKAEKNLAASPLAKPADEPRKNDSGPLKDSAAAKDASTGDANAKARAEPATVLPMAQRYFLY